MIQIPFDNSYARLPEHFFARTPPRQVPEPRLIKVNQPLLAELGIDVEPWDETLIAQAFAGNLELDGAEPIALVYAGHQFGQFVPQLGDGRAVLLGEVVDRHGQRRDLQLKGSGRTAFSRGGDGKAPIGPVLREYLLSEAMHALGVPTTRALAAVATGETVFRDMPVPGAILTRVASSHARIGTVQYFAARNDQTALRDLTHHVLARHYPEHVEAADPGMALLGAVVEQQAKLVAQWMCLGFVHGVMNTDNTSLAGETIDYGPCAFMEHYDQGTSFSSVDVGRRYAYGNQPMVAQWNLARLAEALLAAEDDPNAHLETAKELIGQYFTHYEHYWLTGMRAKLGLTCAVDTDAELIQQWLDLLAANEADFTLSFWALADSFKPGVNNAELQTQISDQTALESWLTRWRARLAQESRPVSACQRTMRQANPAVIPRNHLVEAALTAAEEGDYALFENLLEAVQNPFTATDDNAQYRRQALPTERVFRTFCGT